MTIKIILGAVVGAAVLAGGYFFYQSRSNEAGIPEDKEVVEVKNEEQKEIVLPEPQAGKKMAFSEFVKQDGSYKCEVKQYLSDMDNSGTVYLGDGKTRGDFSTIAEGRKIDTSFIIRDGYSFTWSSALPNIGFKIKIPENSAQGASSAGVSGTYSWNTEQIGDYNCEPWEVDLYQFSLPREVTFNEISAQ